MDNQQKEIKETYEKMTEYFEKNLYRSYQLKIVPSNYYNETLEWRRDQLNAPSIAYLSKTLLMENTNYDPAYASPLYPRYVAIVIQYIAKIDAEKVMKWARHMNQHQKLGKGKFHFRLAPEEVAYELTGYRYNSLTPYLMNAKIPLIISDKITKLPGRFFWIGGGHVDIKLRLGIQECVDKYDDNVYFADVTYDEQ